MMSILTHDPRDAAAAHAGGSEQAASITTPPPGGDAGSLHLTPYGRTVAEALARGRWMSTRSFDVHNGVEWVRYYRLLGGLWTSRPLADRTGWQTVTDTVVTAGLEALYVAR